MSRQKGFTMIELCTVIAIFFLLLPPVFLTTERLYRYHHKIRVLNDLKQSSKEIFVKIERDIRLNGNCNPDSDNHGIQISTPKGVILYYLKDKAIYQATGNRTMKLSAYPVEDATFIVHDNSLIVNIVMSALNINTRKMQIYKFMESIDV